MKRVVWLRTNLHPTPGFGVHRQTSYPNPVMPILLPPTGSIPRPGLRRALGFLNGWFRPSPAITLSVVERSLPGLPKPIRVLEAAPGAGGDGAHGRPLPGWVLLHGVTVLGLDHPSLLRFVQAMAASGARVMVPEITPWTALDLDLDEAQRRLRGSIQWLAHAPGVAAGGVGVAGFSFGGPQALLAASDPHVARDVRQVLAWGSYARLPGALHFALTGEYEHAGGIGRLEPDPYGRWVTAASLLPWVGQDAQAEALGASEVGAPLPDFAANAEVARLVADALRGLARRWGAWAMDAMHPSGDLEKAAVRRTLPPEAHPLFDLLAPPAGIAPDREMAEALGRGLIGLAARHSPLMDPLRGIQDRGGIGVPVHLLHGREDILIPWSETEKLQDALTGFTPALYTEITGLFAHTDHGPQAGVGGSGGVGAIAQIRARTKRAREGARFFRALRQVLG